MDGRITFAALAGDAEWDALEKSIQTGGSDTLPSLLRLLRSLGALCVVKEGLYIDRDFSAAYAAFYATLFEPHLKYCERWHFFASDVLGLMSSGSPLEVVLGLEAQAGDYLGFITIRPVSHAPVSQAIISSVHVDAGSETEISVRASYQVHVLGAELSVTGVPVTEQDTRVGACAQSAIWTIGRHFTRRHGSGWFALPSITELALKPIDSFISRSLPEGSEYLTPDNMVRALRAMDRHPVVYCRTNFQDPASWQQRPEDVLFRYLDSGIPVIVGLAPPPGSSIGHGVVAVGHKRLEKVDTSALANGPTLADGVDAFLVNDDQRGLYCTLPKEARSPDYPWSLNDDCLYLIVPLPGKVFFKADTAERLARNYLNLVINAKAQLAQMIGTDPASLSLPPDNFEAECAAGRIVARTYLTYGWKYKHRALRNEIAKELKEELLKKQLPRFVWVTEFSRLEEAFSTQGGRRKIRAHVVLDATGNPFSETALVVDIPGLALHWNAQPSSGPPKRSLVVRATEAIDGYWAKVRGEA